MDMPDYSNHSLDEFQMGVMYERTRIMDLLRTTLPDDLHGLLKECEEEGMVPITPWEGIMDFASLVMSQPIHTKDEAGANIVNGFPLTLDAAVRAMQSLSDAELNEQRGFHPIIDEMIDRVLGERNN